MWTKLCPRSNAAEETTRESSTLSNGLTIRNAKTGQKNHSTTFGRRSGETSRVSSTKSGRAKGLPTCRRLKNRERPASQAQELVKGYLGFGRTRAVGVRYDTPLYVHLRGTTGSTRARTPSEEGHSFHVSHVRKNVICSCLRTTNLSGDDRNDPALG